MVLEAISPDRKKCLLELLLSACHVGRYCSADMSAGSNSTVQAACRFDQIGVLLAPSATITAATADRAYFTPLCLLCKLDINSLVGGLLFMQVPFAAAGPLQQLHPLSFGEGISLDPLPPKEIRWAGPGCDFCLSPKKWQLKCCGVLGLEIIQLL